MRWRIALLTLTIGLGLVGLVSADETGNWFTRLFTPGAAKNEAVKEDPSPIPTSNVRRAKKAKADLERRQEVCLKLRDLANTNNDEETLRKVELLEKRAYELYVAGIAFRSSPAVEIDAKKGGANAK